MVNRRTITLTKLSEGSATLPSVLKINKERHFNAISGAALSNGVVRNARVLDGAIGNNYNEFSIEFLADNSESMTVGIKRLYASVINDIFITIKKDLELDRYFKIYRIDDLSYQAMTMNNYDFFVKLFKTQDGESVKISSNAIAILKSYTSKDAWLLLDKSVSNNTTDEFKLIIDFTYRFFKDETYNKLRFPNVNTYSNNQDLFNNTQYSSPYYDTYMLRNTDPNKTMAFLNPQSEYIGRIIRDIFTFAGTSKNFTLKDFPRPAVTIMRTGDSEDWDINKFKQRTLSAAEGNLEQLENYIRSLSFEVYGYKSGENIGHRCFLRSTYLENGRELQYSRYEIYPVLPGVVHYIYTKKASDTHDITINNIRKSLKEKNVYLYNYAEMSINTFVEDSLTYIDIYTHIPYTYEAYDKCEDTALVLNSDIDDHADSELTDMLDVVTLNGSAFVSNDARSRFDISRTYEAEYQTKLVNGTNINKDSYFMPYYGNDIFVKSIISNNGSLLKIPQVFSNDIDLLELKEANTLNKYFDILCSDDGFTDVQTANTIDSAEVITSFENVGIRSGYEHFAAATEMECLEADNFILCENFEDLLPDNVTRDYCLTSGIGVEVDLTDCLFLFVDTTGTQRFINLTFVYKLNNNTNVELFKSYESYSAAGGKFIIPADPDFLLKIRFNNNGYRYYVMK